MSVLLSSDFEPAASTTMICAETLRFGKQKENISGSSATAGCGSASATGTGGPSADDGH